MIQSRFAYLVCMVLATIVAGWILRRSQKGLPLEGYQRWAIGLGAIVGATFAAKLPFVVFGNHSSLLGAWLGDGKTVLWGLAGGYLGVEIAKWATCVRLRTGDSFVIAVAAAIAVGRFGCLLYGCCGGIASDVPWAIRFPDPIDGSLISRHPTQVYEITFHVGFAVIVWSGQEWKRFAGNWMPTYLVVYSAFRFATEFVRIEPDVWGGWTFYQLSSLGIGLAFASLLAVRYTAWRRSGATSKSSVVDGDFF